MVGERSPCRSLRGNPICKDAEVRRSLVCLWKSKEASVAGGGQVVERESGEEAEVRLCKALVRTLDVALRVMGSQ